MLCVGVNKIINTKFEVELTCSCCCSVTYQWYSLPFVFLYHVCLLAKVLFCLLLLLNYIINGSGTRLISCHLPVLWTSEEMIIVCACILLAYFSSLHQVMWNTIYSCQIGHDADTVQYTF